jgi:hypothetical protein
MKVINYEAHHVMGVEHINYDLEGWHLFHIGGANGQGKSSSIKGLLMALCGRSGMDYPKPALREGEDEGWIKVKLSGSEQLHEQEHLNVELHFERKDDGSVRESFRVIDSTGEEAPEPRTLLKRLYETRAFDPMQFDKMSKAERRKVLMDVVGLDFSSFESKRKLVYETRTSVNAEAKRRQAVLKNKSLHEGVPEEKICTSRLLDELKDAEKSNSQLEIIARELAVVESGIASSVSSIEEVTQEIDRKKKHLEYKKELLKKMKQTRAAARKKIKELPKAVSLDKFRKSIAEAGDVNQKIAENEAYLAEQSEVSELIATSEKLTEDIKQLDLGQDVLLQETEWPIKGMSVDADGVLLDGLPFESACLSQRISASVNVGMALNPELRLLVCEDGSSLDVNTLKQIQAELKEKDYTMLVEVVTRTEQDEDMCAVVIKEGRVVKDRGAAKC